MAAKVQAESRKIDWRLVAETTDPAVVREVAARETGRWGALLLFLGVMNLIRAVADTEAGLDPVWPVLLIVVGAVSYYFRSAVMLAVYGMFFAWAALNNLLTGSVPWMVVAALQAGLAFFVFRPFVKIRRAARRLSTGLGYETPAAPDRAAAIIPWAGCALTGAAGIGLCLLIIGLGVWAAVNAQEPSEQAVEAGVQVLFDLVFFGMALTVAALLARYRFRVVSILAVVGAALTLVSFLLLALVGQGS